VVVSIVLKLTAGIAAGLWAGDLLSKFVTGSTDGVEGITSQAMQQGGVGILMSMLLISIPPMAAMFFNGTIGNFSAYSMVGPPPGSSRGPQGQPPGSYSGGNASQPVNSSTSPNQVNTQIQPRPAMQQDDAIKSSRGTQSTEV
jgi:type IV secretion system protein VirB6